MQNTTAGLTQSLRETGFLDAIGRLTANACEEPRFLCVSPIQVGEGFGERYSPKGAFPFYPDQI